MWFDLRISEHLQSSRSSLEPIMERYRWSGRLLCFFFAFLQFEMAITQQRGNAHRVDYCRRSLERESSLKREPALLLRNLSEDCTMSCVHYRHGSRGCVKSWFVIKFPEEQTLKNWPAREREGKRRRIQIRVKEAKRHETVVTKWMCSEVNCSGSKDRRILKTQSSAFLDIDESLHVRF